MSTSTADGPAARPDQRPPSRNPHLHGTIQSMIWSTVVVAAIVLAFYALVARPAKVERPAVDVAGVATEARRSTGQPLGVLEGLGDGWAPTIASLQPDADGLTTWQARYVKGEDRYVVVYQAAKATSGWVQARTAGRQAGPGMTAAGVPVDTYGAGSSCTLVHKGGGAGLTTVVETNDSCEQAAAYAAHLKPAMR